MTEGDDFKCKEKTLSIFLAKMNRQKYCILMRIYGLQENDTDEPICRERTEMQM